MVEEVVVGPGMGGFGGGYQEEIIVQNNGFGGGYQEEIIVQNNAW